MDYVILKKEENYLGRARDSLKKYGFCVIKGFFPYEPLIEILKDFEDNFSALNDTRRTGPYKYKMPNFQRLDLGDFAQVNARFSRMFTRFSWNHSGGLDEPIKKLIEFRNELFGLQHKDFIYDLEGTQLCDLPKVLHYPCGGGFMNKHHDVRNLPSVSNTLLSLSKRGKNFDTGGVYYIDKNGQFLDVEKVLDVGDVYMHELETFHGVKAIDIEKNVDLISLEGRLAINLSLEDFVI